MTFNIIYTPHTVDKLYLFTLSLMDQSSFRFRLVVNGCEDGETRFLERFAEQYPERLSVLRYPSEGMRPHYEVLDYLQGNESEPFFAFMDSDILALGNWTDLLQEELHGADALFSGRPVWSPTARRPPVRKKAAGRFMVDTDGFCLGGTYFAVYNNDILNRVRERFGVGFENRWWKELPESISKILKDLGRRFERYDNGKVINILMQSLGHRCGYTEDLRLCHFGGMSRFNTVLGRDKEKLKAHEKHRQGQKDMRMIASFMSQAIAKIKKEESIEIPAEIRNHFAQYEVASSIKELRRIREKYREVSEWIEKDQI
ncbi:MAG: glycosyltransferase family A protein [Saprospiraceae bacterium]|nr:glycosyltransferase family A protein [Saprospiraceae bacterium]